MVDRSGKTAFPAREKPMRNVGGTPAEQGFEYREFSRLNGSADLNPLPTIRAVKLLSSELDVLV